MNSRNWLLISVTLNVAALLLIAHLSRRPAASTFSSNNATSPAYTRAAAANLHSVPVPKNDTPAPTTEADAKNWIQSLRAAGVPEQLIADVVAADFESHWELQRRELQKKFDRGEVDDEAFQQFHLQHASEEEKALRDALGDAGFLQWDKERTLSGMDLSGLNLSGEESNALYQLRKNLAQQQRALAESHLKGTTTEADLELQTEANQADYEKQLKDLLGAERYATMNTVPDVGASELRRTLRGLNLTDAQADEMSQTQQKWSKQRAKVEADMQSGKLATQDYDQQLKTLEAAREQDYQRVLGADGYAEFQKAQDSRYQMLKRYENAWGLNDHDVNNLYSTIQFYEKSVRDYQQRARAAEEQGQPVDWPTVQKVLADFSRQTEDALRKSLGKERFDKLKQNNVFASGQ